MKYFSAVRDRKNDSVIDTVQSDTDYIDADGKLHIHTKKIEVMVTAKSDLDNLTGYPPTTIAFTAGLNNVWQLAADGTWVAIVEEETNNDVTPEENGDVTPEENGDVTPEENGG